MNVNWAGLCRGWELWVLLAPRTMSQKPCSNTVDGNIFQMYMCGACIAGILVPTSWLGK